MGATGTAPAPEIRDDRGRFRPGQTGNAAGIPGSVRQLQGLIRLAHGNKVLTALQRLFEMGTDTSTTTVVTRKGEAIEVDSIPPATRVAALSAFVDKVGALTGLEAAARQQQDEPPADEGELVDRVIEGVLAKPEHREKVAAKLAVLQGGKP